MASRLRMLPFLLPLLLYIPRHPKVSNHKIITFSDRTLSKPVISLLRSHGFHIHTTTTSTRPPHLHPRWEKVFLLSRHLHSPWHTVTWLDDDALPPPQWLRRAVTQKTYPDLFVATDYGNANHQIMSNILVFRTSTNARQIVDNWLTASSAFVNVTTGLQDQDALNRLISCGYPGVMCVTHDINGVHTTGTSAQRLDVLARTARRFNWRNNYLPVQVFIWAMFCGSIITMHATLLTMVQRVYELLKYVSILLGVAGAMAETIPGVSHIGRVPELACKGPGKVIRFGDSSLSLGGRWLFTKGALVYADCMNRLELACLTRFQAELLMNVIEHRDMIRFRIWTAVAMLTGALIGIWWRTKQISAPEKGN